MDAKKILEGTAVPKIQTQTELLLQAIRWHERGHVDDVVLARIRTGKPVTLAEMNEQRVNSYERHLLYHLYDDEALAVIMDYCAMNTQACFTRGSYPLDHAVGDHYDEVLALVLVPLAVARLRAIFDAEFTAVAELAEIDELLTAAGCSDDVCASQRLKDLLVAGEPREVLRARRKATKEREHLEIMDTFADAIVDGRQGGDP